MYISDHGTSLFFEYDRPRGGEYTLTEVARRLLDCFFVGFGIAAAVHLVVLPVTTRDLVTLLLTEYLHRLKAVLDAQDQFITSLPARNWGDSPGSSGSDRDDHHRGAERVTAWPEADTWKTATAEASESQVKIQSEMRYVKREFAWGKLAAADYVQIVRLLKNVLLPMIGMETVIQVADRVETQGGWAATSAESVVTTTDELERWHGLFRQLKSPVQRLWQAMIEGLDYAFYTLEITKKPAFSTTAELDAKGGLASSLDQSIQNFLHDREEPLKEWCRLNGMDPPCAKSPLHQRHQFQLYLILDVSILCGL